MSGKAAPTSGIGILAGVLALGMAVSVSAAPFAPEPAGLWPGPMQGATPRTLKNATVLDRPEMARLIEAKHPVLIDVANLEHEPAGRTPGLDWEPVHRTVPGAIWLPSAGIGHDAPGFVEAFAKRIARATGGDKDKPILTFCHAQRWGSWNAAKRLTELGYRHVYWYPGGGEGWGVKEPTAVATEDVAWKATGFDTSSAGDMPSSVDR